jgi:hypothetical protein
VDEIDGHKLLPGLDADIAAIVRRLSVLVREVLPDATTEVDAQGTMVGFTYRPGTYKGLIVAIVPHRRHVNLMFARGVDLLDHEAGGLLEGTGKKARHIAFRAPATVDTPEVRALLRAAAAATPRG